MNIQFQFLQPPFSYERLHQVYANLLSNSFKFTQTRDKASIKIGTIKDSNPIVYYVQDNDVGFDEEYAGKLFGVFQRLQHQDEFEGTGIGLANVKRIITRHGGKIWTKSMVNQRTTFYFTLAPSN